MINRLTRRVGAQSMVVAAAALLLGACSVDKVLRVPDPDVSRPGDLTGKASLPTLLAAAVGDFQVAFAGTGTGPEGLVNMTGLFTDEFAFTETFPTRVEVDKRSIDRNNSTMLGIYFNAQSARQSTFRAESAYAKLAPNDSAYAEALSLEGYSFLFLAEAYCSGVPITKLDASGKIIPGQPLTTQQLLDSAINRFSAAVTVANATGSSYLANLAKVGQARALIFKTNSNLAQAAALVATVPSDFEYIIFSSSNTGRQNNGVFELQWLEGRWSQADSEGINGLLFRRSNDPRTPYADLGLGFDNQRELFASVKYASRDASTVLASYTEAQLIIAEAQLAAGNYATPVTGTLAILNALRSAASMSALAPAVGAAAQRTQLFVERGFWLYLTAHRLGDLRRLSRSVANGGYGLNSESVFPTGIYRGRGGGVYGPDVNFPIPIEEANSNPNAPACLDRNP
jgi:starch-binding outer membrane protein, SusD/RagB family